MKDTRLLLVIILVLYFTSTLQGSPATFKVRVINDEGKVFDEVVKIDVAKKTEIFHVPSHEQSDEADVIHDFRKRLTVIRLPGKKVCYLSELNNNLPLPKEMKNAFIKAATVHNDSNLQKVKATMVAKEVVEDRSSLSKVMRKACENFPIYRTEPVEESVSITPISSQGGQARGLIRRSTCSGSVCFTVQICYLVCPTCIECREEKICPDIDC